MAGKTTLKIFIASSSELKEEREKCILFINHLNKSHKHLDLDPVEWEYDMVQANFPGFENIQSAINPKLFECELAVFLFYSKIGKYTREEFNIARREGKRLFAYFKDGFTPKKESLQSFGELLEFKESLNDSVLYNEYKNLTDLEKLFYSNLNLFLAENYPPRVETDHGASEAKINLDEEFSEIKSTLQSILRTYPWRIGLLILLIISSIVIAFFDSDDYKIIFGFSLICIILLWLHIIGSKIYKNKIVNHDIHVKEYRGGPPPPLDIIVTNIKKNSEITIF